MNVIKNEHGVFHVRKKVPKKLEEATATVMGSSKHRVAWLKKSLGTKDLKAAKVRATSVLMEFDRILSEAEALLVERPLRTSLQPREIERIADFYVQHTIVRHALTATALSTSTATPRTWMGQRQASGI